MVAKMQVPEKQDSSTNQVVLPLVPLRGLVVFPGQSLTVEVGRPRSLAAIEAARAHDGRVLFLAQRDPECEDPGQRDLYEVGSVVAVHAATPTALGRWSVRAEGLARARALGFTAGGRVTVALLPDAVPTSEDAQQDVLLARVLLERAASRLGTNGALPPAEQPGRVADVLASRLLGSARDRQMVLEAGSVRERLDLLLHILADRPSPKMQRELSERVRSQLERAQREQYLREQLRVIQKELGEGDGVEREAEQWHQALVRADPPSPVLERGRRELTRLLRMPSQAPEAAVVRAYLEWLTSLPWSARSEEMYDLDHAAAILDADHHGLEDVKERILEYLAVHILRAQAGVAHGPGLVLCLLGPPGTGKTSLARSIARALGRPFVAVSLGGVRDEAELRGHRRTYVGAMPGRIISALRQAGRRNPVLLLDEVDKIGTDVRGDPASALLEILDPQQNTAFRDHYLELPFDLSEVLFITTANSLVPLPTPLRDRLEVIELPGYDDEDKLQIARQYLLPRQMEQCGLTTASLSVSDGALRTLIAQCGHEAGVRSLEREIGRIGRKAAREWLLHPGTTFRVTQRNVADVTGQARPAPPTHRAAEVGVCWGVGLGDSGGALVPIEVAVLPGSGLFQWIGQAGPGLSDVAQAALTFLRAQTSMLSLSGDDLALDLHVHVPRGVQSGDTSLGIAVVTAMVSALKGWPVPHDLAMIGEISLRGRVLPVARLTERVLAARRGGVRMLVVPQGDMGAWDAIPPARRSGLEAVGVRAVQEALRLAFPERWGNALRKGRQGVPPAEGKG